MDNIQLIFLSPSFNEVVGDVLRQRLKSSGHLNVVTKPEDLDKVKQLFTKGNKVLAIDPLFCNWTVPNMLISKITNLKAICLMTRSADWVDASFTRELGIPLTNTRDFYVEAVSEWAIMMMFCLARRIPLVAKSGWQQRYGKFQGVEVMGKTEGIIGMGQIGQRIAQQCQGLGMKVQYWSPHTHNDRYWYVSLNKLLATSDVVFPTYRLSAGERMLPGETKLNRLGRKAILIDVVRIDNKDHEFLLRQVAKDKLFGYGFEEDGGNHFDKYKGNVWAGPALAWVTDRAMKLQAESWVESVVQATKGNFPNRVN